MSEDHIRRNSVVTEAMLRIKELVMSDQYQPGDKLPTEHELAERFGIGRSSIREAIKVFQYLGILETKVPKGTFVCRSSNIAMEFFTWFTLMEPRFIDEILELREVFEQRGVYQLMRKCKDQPVEAQQAVSRLEEQTEKMEDAVHRDCYEDILLADYEFHRILINETGNSLFISMYDLLKHFTMEEMEKTHESYTDYTALAGVHRRIIEAVKSGDTGTAINIHGSHFPLIKDNLDQVGLTRSISRHVDKLINRQPASDPGSGTAR